MKFRHISMPGILLVWLLLGAINYLPLIAQAEQTPQPALTLQSEKIQNNLELSLQELAALQEQIAAEKLPLAKKLSRGEESLSKARATYDDYSSKLDGKNMDLNNLRTQIESLGQQKSYVSSLLGEYVRSLETQLHIAEVQKYENTIRAAKLGMSNETLETARLFELQLAAVESSIDRLEKLNGGMRYTGQAIGEEGVLLNGQFALIGPAAYFTSEDGTTTGHVVDFLGSAKPTVVAFGNQESRSLSGLNPIGLLSDSKGSTMNFFQATQSTLQRGNGQLPLDPTLGDAHKIAQTHDTLWEHIQKGGVVMIPILALAGLALIIAMGKWFQLARIKMPSAKKLTPLLSDIRDRSIREAKRKARQIKGPAGELLQSAVTHLHQPKELVEEVMYEKILETRNRLNKTLPFIAVCASSAPLFGLLGTVTGIINTFKLISAFGSGDAKTLSGGISEALVTTEFGLIVAIPSLLIHAFLNRKAKSLIDRMERIAVGVMNQITQSNYRKFEESDESKDSTLHIAKEVSHA